VHPARRHDGALFARVGSDWLIAFEKQKRRQRAARFDASRRDQLRDIEDVNRGKTGIFRLVRIYKGESGVGGSKIYANFHSMPTFIFRAR